MRARLAIAASAQKVELREILLRDKAPEFLATSPSGTVPCLKVDDQVIDESLDVMKWALGQNDPQNWLDMPDEGHALIATADGPFKQALDRTKYHVRYADADPEAERAKAYAFLADINDQLGPKAYLFKDSPSLADMAILPFVRQFANIDKPRFDADVGPNTARWLESFLASDRFAAIMPKYPVWASGDAPTFFLT